MSEQYKIWIEQYVKSQKFILGMCDAATKEMVKAFPELKRVPGHVETGVGRRAHWWCVDPDGNIIDPTASQFESYGGLFDYDPWVPGSLTRVGKCMNCGDEIWEPVETLDPPPANKSSCSKECEQILLDDFKNIRKNYASF